MKPTSRWILVSIVLCEIILIFATDHSWGAEGRIPISEPITISTSGSYIVTEDISINSVAADHVSIDLDGHTLTSSLTTADVIKNAGVTFGDITIKNGKIAGGQYQVNLNVNDDLLAVENIVAVPNGAGTGQGIFVRGS